MPLKIAGVLIYLKQLIQLKFALVQALPVSAINDIYKRIRLVKVVAPAVSHKEPWSPHVMIRFKIICLMRAR